MITLAACPRCGGAVLDYGTQMADSPLCLICGWRQRDIPLAIQAEVAAHLGKSYVQNGYLQRPIGRGKPPLSGWERAKRRRETQGQKAG